uniref:Uncharacterized protein n=1 Tax=Plectus sambesii TaxID=2011161 RepID=A0A914UR97_9BILA
MSSQKIIVALMVLVAIVGAAPKSGILSASPAKTIATAVENHGNPAVQEATCGGQPTELQCVFCHCTWLNNVCTGTAPTC